MKSVIERILSDEKIRDIILDEDMPYPKSMAGNYPKGGSEGKMNQLVANEKEHPTNKVDLGAKVGDETPAFAGTTGGKARGLAMSKATMRKGSVDLRGSITGKAPSARGKIVTGTVDNK